MKRIAWCIVPTCAVICALALVTPARADRETTNFADGWLFSLGGQDSAARPGFDDSAWQAIRLPHDWAIAGRFDAAASGRTGKLPWRGEGWYRKRFTLPPARPGRRVYLHFDGVMAMPKVYVNGHLAGEWDYGYMAFRVDATAWANFGGENVVAVHADTRRHGSRWYPGAGIYRPVTMILTDAVHVCDGGVQITTPKVDDESAVVRVQTEVVNHLPMSRPVQLAISIVDSEGRTVAESLAKATAAGNGEVRTFDQRLVIPGPRRWDVDSPELYRARLRVSTDAACEDNLEQPFGIRTAEFTADDGFHLNGRRLRLHGVNLHHDHGPLGAAVFSRAVERRLRILKDMGVNAIRTSHNPPATLLLDWCDRLGLVVINECFDKWDATADLHEQPFDAFMTRQIGRFVRRDRNHPCVILWSIGNEMGNVESNRDGEFTDKVAHVVSVFKQHDPTRPVTQGCLWPPACRRDNPVFQVQDVTSWNYGGKYARAREVFPEKPIVYSESASAVSTRGFYELPHPWAKDDFSDTAHQVDSYDLNAAWGPRDIPDVDLYRMEQDAFVAGQFVWAGFDYLGEPTPFKQQARSSYYGIIDLCGIPKDRFYLYRSQWAPERTTIYILPHWNWPARVGQRVPVYVYTNGDSAELFLNGRSLGRRSKGTGPTTSLREPRNLAADGNALASASDPRNPPEQAHDGTTDTRWSAPADTQQPWWALDLGRPRRLRSCHLVTPEELRHYQFVLEASDDGVSWSRVAAKEQWGESRERDYYAYFDTDARYLRVRFTSVRRGPAAIADIGVYEEPVGVDGQLPPYYQVMDRYRLRWEDVIYEPGELKAVAYRGGRQIGKAVVRTAGDAVALRLTPERPTMLADGDDLAYVLVEAVDSNGTVCPLADPLVELDVVGPAELIGAGNGNPLCLEPFTASNRSLFHGKAVVIVRSQCGRVGKVTVTARADGLLPAEARLDAERCSYPPRDPCCTEKGD